MSDDNSKTQSRIMIDDNGNRWVSKDLHIRVSESQKSRIKHLEAELKEAKEWVSVDDRLPDTEATVFIRLKTSGVIDYSSDNFSLIDNVFVSFGNAYITHWKPITPPSLDRE